MEHNREEQLERELAELKGKVEAMSEKPKNPFFTRFKEVTSRALFNAIDDMPTTLPGIISGVSIVAVQYPNIQTHTVIEALGISTVGAFSTSKGKAKTEPFVDVNELG